MKRRLWLLGLVSIALAVLVVLLLSAVQRGTAPAATPLYPRPGGDRTAKQALRLLQSWSESWAQDAQIVAVSASLLKSEGMRGGGWTFQLYSPSKQQLAIVLVGQSQVWVLKKQTALYPQKTLPLSAWQVDSDEFIANWWEEGGGSALWRHPEAQSLHMRLGLRKDGVAIWTLNLISTKGALLNTWSMRADTGEVIPINVSGG